MSPVDTPKPEAYDDVERQFRLRRRRFLRMMAFRHEDGKRFAQSVPAQRRKYLTDRTLVGDEDASQGWVRLRQPPDEAWQKRIGELQKTAKTGRRDAKATVWSDDPLDRDDAPWPGSEEDVNIAGARMVVEVLEAGGAFDDLEDHEALPKLPPFPPPIYSLTPFPGERVPLKRLLLTLADLGVVQVVGGPMNDKDVKEALAGRVDTIVLDAADTARPPVWIDGAPVPPVDLLGRVKEAVKKFSAELHVPVRRFEPAERDIFAARWLGIVPHVDPGQMLEQLGFDLAEGLLQLARVCTSTAAVRATVDLYGWLASTAGHAVSHALPIVSDVFAFHGEPLWLPLQSAWGIKWADTSFVAPAPARPESLIDGDDTWYRTLTCQAGPAANPDAQRFFRTKARAFVPEGWRWPATDRHFAYWWNAVLKRHCVEVVLPLGDMGDFHANDLLRFCCLFGLFTDAPDARVPPYVAPCIKAALLHFKYWMDEPAAAGNKGGEMTFWSENHQMAFHTAQFLAGQLFADGVFQRSGVDANGRLVTGLEHERRGRERVERWLDRRLKFGFSEFNSPGYYNEDFPTLFNLVDFSLDDRIAGKAAMVLDVLIFDLARNTCRGSFGAAAGRAYFEHKGYGWEQGVGETIEVLFGTRGDHIDHEKSAIALCTSPRYIVPGALLAIGRDRQLLDRGSPLEFRNRVSIDLQEAGANGIGFGSLDDAAFWWGCGAYFDPDTIEMTRAVARRYPNLDSTNPPALLFKWNLFAPYLQALLLDTAQMAAGGAAAAGTSLLVMAPLPLNLFAGAAYVASVSLMIEGLIGLIEDLAGMIRNALEFAASLLTGEDPPPPRIPEPEIQRAWEAMLMQFNAGNVLSRANLYTYAIGDAMLSSAQNHRAGQVSFQKQPWIASLGCDACVWTNAPLDYSASVGSASWEVFKHLATCQAGRALGDIGTFFDIGLDDIRDEGLRDWGGSICLPKVAQHRGAAIIAYDFPLERGVFSDTYTHAWFPCGFFDEVSPAPAHDDWLPSRDGGGTWVFGRKDDGYVALCSARKMRWLKDERFKDDPDPLAPDRTLGQGPFTSTELRAESGSNIWVSAIGNRTGFGSFAAFKAAVERSYLHFSGVGALGQLQCTFDMPEAPLAGEPGFRWELFYDDNEAHLDGVKRPLASDPRYEGRYVEGRAPGRVEWRESSYRIVHPITGLWVSHDTTGAERVIGPPRVIAKPTPGPTPLNPRTAVALRPGRVALPPPIPKPTPRARRFQLETTP